MCVFPFAFFSILCLSFLFVYSSNSSSLVVSITNQQAILVGWYCFCCRVFLFGSVFLPSLLERTMTELLGAPVLLCLLCLQCVAFRLSSVLFFLAVAAQCAAIFKVEVQQLQQQQQANKPKHISRRLLLKKLPACLFACIHQPPRAKSRSDDVMPADAAAAAAPS